VRASSGRPLVEGRSFGLPTGEEGVAEQLLHGASLSAFSRFNTGRRQKFEELEN